MERKAKHRYVSSEFRASSVWVILLIFGISMSSYGVTISGRIVDCDGLGVPEVDLIGWPGPNPKTDANGNYSGQASVGETFEITPTKAGISFDPTSRHYDNIQSDQRNHDYSVTPCPPVPISGRVTDCTGAGVQGVRMSGWPGTDPITDTNGNYTGTSPTGQSFTITPTKTGLTFNPPSRRYDNIQSDQTNHDYSVTPCPPVTISGRVTDCTGAGVEGVRLAGWPGTDPITDTNGNYSGTSATGQSFTITPTKTGLTFDPPSRLYDNIQNNQTNQDYSVVTPCPKVTISGRVTDCTGAGVQGVRLAGWPATDPITDANGDYSGESDKGQTFTITPTKTGLTFDPPSRLYDNIQNDQPNHDYSVTPCPPVTISGRVTDCGGAGVQGVRMAGWPGTDPITDANGNYSGTSPTGQSFTITPTKTGLTFNPPSRRYDNIQNDQTNQDYSVCDLPVTICGRVTDCTGAGVQGVRLAGWPGTDPITDANGNYCGQSDRGQTFPITPTKTGLTFDPPSRRYDNIQSNQTNQDYSVVTPCPRVTISGYVRTPGGSGISGVQMTGWPGTVPVTDNNGFYTGTVANGWSGTINPERTGWAFNLTRSYSNVTSDRTGQNYRGDVSRNRILDVTVLRMTPSSGSNVVAPGSVDGKIDLTLQRHPLTRTLKHFVVAGFRGANGRWVKGTVPNAILKNASPDDDYDGTSYGNVVIPPIATRKVGARAYMYLWIQDVVTHENWDGAAIRAFMRSAPTQNDNLNRQLGYVRVLPAGKVGEPEAFSSETESNLLFDLLESALSQNESKAVGVDAAK